MGGDSPETPGRSRRPGPKPGSKRAGQRVLTDDRRAAARRLYEQTSTTRDLIARTFGIAGNTITNAVSAEGWRRGETLVVGPDGLGGACPGVDLCPVRIKAQRRLYATLERRLCEAEDQSLGDSAADRERAVRALSSLTRTLDKLIDMDRQAGEALRDAAVADGPGKAVRKTGHASGQTEGEAPYDVDGLRRALSRRLAGLLGGGEAG